MTPERHQQVKEIFNSALEYPAEQRGLFLIEMCAGDEDLRAEVESLLRVFDAPDNPLDTPVAEVAAGVIDHQQNVSYVGKVIGHYRIEREIGHGGMGVVYLARDSRLDRPVAIKFLPTYTTHAVLEESRLRRFQQEARAVSALNHPNIVTIHEIGEHDGLPFIVSEYIDGQTLREWAYNRKIKPSDALEIVIQAAGALSVAHKVGLVHRDVKPENIMVRSDGYVKVLDFGLAKLTEKHDFTTKPMDWRLQNITTTPGIVMGTVNYMSPEQARAQSVDERSDIFSLGVVLYEMIASRTPFSGDSTPEVLAAIIKELPPPLQQFAPDAPSDLQTIVDKALKKDRNERYQSFSEMLADMQELKRDLDSQARDRRSPSQGVNQETTVGVIRPDTGRMPARNTSGVEYLISEIKRHKTGAAIGLVGILALLVVGSFAGYQMLHSVASIPVLSLEKSQFTKLTTSGKVYSCAISPDGKYFAYSSNDGGGKQSLFLQQIGSASSLTLAPSADMSYPDLIFSPDSSYLYYSASDASNTKQSKFYQIPILGGDARELFSDVRGLVAIAPDGKKACFVQFDLTAGESEVVIGDIGTGQKSVLCKFKGSSNGLAWSPEGNLIAVSVNKVNENKLQHSLIRLISVASGKVEDWANPKIPNNIEEVVWLPDQSGFYLQASEGQNRQIWHVKYPDGDTRRITNDLNGYFDIRLTADGGTLLAIQSIQSANVWLVPADSAAQPRPVTTGQGTFTSADWTSDGKIVAAANLTGKYELWELSSDGSTQRRITFDETNKHEAVVCGDSRYIVFVSSRNGRLNLWRVNRNGTDLAQLTDLKLAIGPDCTTDGQWVVFDSLIDDQWSVWRVPLEGGKPEQVTGNNCNAALLSPDGRFLAYVMTEAQGNISTFVIRPFDGGPPIKSFRFPPTFAGSIRWVPDGKGITFVDKRSGISEIYYQSLDGGEPTKLTDFRSQEIHATGWSRDGKQLAVVRGQRTSDVVRIANAK